MQFLETELFFTQSSLQQTTRVKGVLNDKSASREEDFDSLSMEVLGIKVRLGNAPLVYNFEKLSRSKNKLAPFSSNKDHYLIVHAIGAARISGKAKIEELHYFAEASDPIGLQTIDLVPASKFKEAVKTHLNLEASLSINGEVALKIPEKLTEGLLSEFITLGDNIQLQLSGSAGFVGKLSFNIHLPIVQAIGIATNTCSWILNPDENNTPLLGDQLLVQSISVPKGTRSITYKLCGAVKADKGLLWKQQEKKTPEYTIEVKLDQ